MKYLLNRTILIISPERWDHIPVSKHHYASTLALLGNKVFFLNPPSGQNNVRRTSAEVHVIDYKTIRGVNRMPAFVRNLVNSFIIRQIKKLCCADFDVVWSFDSFRLQNLSLWNAAVKIYHVVDVHIAPLEKELVATADLILSVSDLIHQRISGDNKVKAKINHGLAPWFLDSQLADAANGAAVNSNGRRKVGYVGNLDNWCLDKETLLEIVKENHEVDFYFIGPYHHGSEFAAKLSHFANAMLVGKVPSKQLPAWFEKMDLFLMCYRGADTTVNSNHHKILEFLSTGKPAVINYTDEYKDKRDIILMSDLNEQLPGLFRQACLNLAAFNAPEMVLKRKDFAAANSYQSQVKTIDALIGSLHLSA